MIERTNREERQMSEDGYKHQPISKGENETKGLDSESYHTVDAIILHHIPPFTMKKEEKRGQPIT